MDGGAWQAAVHGVAKSQTWLSDFTFTFHFHELEKEMATHARVLARRFPGMGAWWAAVYGVAQSHTHWCDLAAAADDFESMKCGYGAEIFSNLNKTHLKIFLCYTGLEFPWSYKPTLIIESPKILRPMALRTLNLI